MHRLRSIVGLSLVLASVGCADEVSRCYQAAEVSYAGQLRTLGPQLQGLPGALAALDEHAALLTTWALDPDTTWVWRIDLDSGEHRLLDTWDDAFTLRALLVELGDGRFIALDAGSGVAGRYAIIDPRSPMSAELLDISGIAAEHFSFHQAWRDPVREQIYAGGDYYPDGNDPGAEVWAFAPDTGEMTRLRARADGMMARNQKRPIPRCDGHQLFPGSMFDGGDYSGIDTAMYEFDPDAARLTRIELDFEIDHAAAFDAQTALVLGRPAQAGGVDPRELRLLTLDSVELSEPLAIADLDTPNEDGPALLGLGDGTVLFAHREDLQGAAFSIVDPVAQTITTTSARFDRGPWQLALMLDGRALAASRNTAQLWQ